MLGFVNLEMPANEGPQGLRAMAVSQGGPMVDQVDRTETEQVYPMIVDFETGTADGPDGIQRDVTVSDEMAQPVTDRMVRAWVDVDDFTRVFSVSAQTDAADRTSLQIPQSALDAGAGDRWLHVLAVHEFPRGLTIVPLP